MGSTLDQTARDACGRDGMPPLPAQPASGVSTMFKRIFSLEFVAGALLVTIALLMTAQVFQRYVLHAPLTWSDEVVSLAFTWLCFLGAVIALKHRGHIALTFLIDACPPTARRIWIGAIGLAVTGFLCVLAYAGMRMTMIVHYQLSVGLEVPMSVFYAALPVSAVLMTYYELAHVVRAWKESGR